MFDLLRQMCEGTETDPEARAAEFRRRRGAIDAEIERARTGGLLLLDDTAFKDRFQQFMQILKAFVDAELLAELDARLAAYRAELDGRERKPAVRRSDAEPLRLDFVADDTRSGLWEHPRRTEQEADT